MPSKRENNNKYKWVALAVTLVLHAALCVWLFLIVLRSATPEPAGGILVNMGDAPLAAGMFVPHQLEPDYVPTSPEPLPEVPDEPILTQESPDAPEVKTPPLVDKKKEEAERRRLEQKRIEEQRKREEAEAQRRREAIRQNVSGAFGNTGKAGTGNDPDVPGGRAGSPDGNVTSGGANTGVGGYGSFSLAGRGLAKGTALQRPSYTVQEEGVVVISIIVNPDGRVIQALIGPGTTIGDNTLRNSALKAARATRFNAVDGVNNQSGTITYRFQLN